MNYLGKLATASALALTIGAAGAQAETLRLGTITPDQTIWAQQLRGFAARVAELSGGALTIDYFGNAELGTMADTLRMTLTGRLDMWSGALPALSAVTPELATFSLPYTFDSVAQAVCVVPQMQDMAREAAGSAYVMLGLTPIGTQSLGMREAINRPEQMAGIKVRTAPLPPVMAFFQSIGANPVPLAAAESTPALNTGLVDAVDFAPTFYLATGANQTATFFVPTEHNYNVGAMIVAPQTWARLSEEQRGWLNQAMADSMPFEGNAAGIAAFEERMLNAHRQSGGTVVELSDEDRAAWIAAGRASWAAIIPQMRGNSTGFIDAIVAAQATCGN